MKLPLRLATWHQGLIHDADDRRVALCHTIGNTEEAERIVACVNACAGVTSDALEMMPLKALHDSRTQLCRDLRNTRMLLDAVIADKAALFKALADTDEWLREIRAENLDGSERGVGVRLEQNTELFERYAQRAPLDDETQPALPL